MIRMVSIIGSIIGITALLMTFIKLGKNDPAETGWKANILMAGAMMIYSSYFIWSITGVEKRSDSEMDKLSKLMEYSAKRKEIEQEIYKLTMELTDSSVGEFLDVNRLIIQGQSYVIGDGAINYEGFLSQFGIHKSEVQRQKDFVVFLTPFTDSAAKTYRSCVNVLNEIGIRLQRTDNVVDKSDIMMNIVTQIVKAEFVIANIDGRNPNVYYELGIAHAIGKPTILISKVDFYSAGIGEDVGFDVRQKRIVLYRDEAELEKKLLAQISRIRSDK